ncbi:MAG: hypothetical protein JNM56_06825 [Planctomycetia bacterium]|nr:hypothetical protein [Planctomycetia bacterium]
MAQPSASAWNPTEIRRSVRSLPTGAETVIVMTDVGEAYLKAMGSDAGEHALACEWVGTQLARWFGLSTFDFALIEVTNDNELPLSKSGNARPGPAFVTRSESGETWGGKERELERLVNPDAITRLVLFDTWTLNCDRYFLKDDGRPRINRGNVFLSSEAPPGQFVLKAMDHTHCFTCGKRLSSALSYIDRTKDPRLYGLFPEFRRFLDKGIAQAAIGRLKLLDRPTIGGMTNTIPVEWEVDATARKAVADFLLARADYLAENIVQRLWPQGELFRDEAGDQT